MIRIGLMNILVDDQARALTFYTEKLGFVVKHDFAIGEFRWLTVTSPANPDIELVLEPLSKPLAKDYQEALYQAGVPAAALATDDIQKEYERLTALGVSFKGEPQQMGQTVMALFDDSCGNIINLFQA